MKKNAPPTMCTRNHALFQYTLLEVHCNNASCVLLKGNTRIRLDRTTDSHAIEAPTTMALLSKYELNIHSFDNICQDQL